MDIPTVTRRRFLKAAGAALAAGTVATALPWTSLLSTNRDGTAFSIHSGRDPATTFPQSVASGDPSPTGVVLWTRVAPDRLDPAADVGLEVARDEDFTDVVQRLQVPAAEVVAEHAHTVRVDLDGALEPASTYYYRFVHGGVASRTGRCRTLPEPGADVDRVRFALLTCQNFQNGYFPALGHVADEDVDFVLHLGDFIYEYDGHASYNGKTFPGRGMRLPSGKPRMENREDLDYVWGRYRADPHVRRMMERHTIIVTWDDHEITNDRSFDYDKGHHVGDATFHMTDGAQLDAFFREGAQAYFDWMPMRIPLDKEAEDPLDVITLYRRFTFGSLVDLWMLDERWFRTPAPSEGLGSPDPDSIHGSGGDREDPGATLLGPAQKEWLLGGLRDSRAQWKVLGQQVQMSPLAATLPGTSVYLNLDAWDGYEAERRTLADALGAVDNAVVLTGDLHTYMVGYVQKDYNNSQGPLGAADNRVAVEFMTPGVTSAGLGEIVEEATGKPVTPGDDEVMENFVLAGNPHMEMFNSTRHGYSVVEFNKSVARYSGFVVDKSQSGTLGNRFLMCIYECPAGRVDVREVLRRSPSGLSALEVADVVRQNDPRRDAVPGPGGKRRAVKDVHDLGAALREDAARRPLLA